MTTQVLGADGPVLTVAATNEEELTQWLQSLCEAVLKKEVGLIIVVLIY